MSVANTKGYYSIPLPVGSIISFAGQSTAIPYGFEKCDGQQFATDAYPELFSVIGYKYGNVGGEFKLPDLNNNNRLITGSDTSTLPTTNAPQISTTLTETNIPDGISLDITAISTTASIPLNGSGYAQAIEFNNQQPILTHTSGGDFIDAGAGVNLFSITATSANVSYTGQNTPFTADITGDVAETIQLIYIIKASY